MKEIVYDKALLSSAQNAWAAMASIRRERERCKKYCYGDQWCDMISVDGTLMREDDYIRSAGNIPLKNNLIRRLVRNVVGVYRSQDAEPQCTARDRDEQHGAETLSTLLQYTGQINRLKELNARSLEEFLIAGIVVHKKWHGRREGRVDCWTDMVDISRFFMDSESRDPRGWDCGLIGEMREMTFAEIAARFSGGSRERRNMLQNIFEPCPSSDDEREVRKHRVVEVWHKRVVERYRCHDPELGTIFVIPEEHGKEIERENAVRAKEERISMEWFAEDVWHYTYLGPQGEVLETGVSPYAHAGHPYVYRAYPMIDGEVHSFVADVIDQQRYTNRFITMYDWIMRSSAKGVLLVPEQAIGNTDPRSFAKAWSSFNGVIFYSPKPGVPPPQQIAANSTNIGISELLQLQLRFFEDISGVNSALQGNVNYSGTSGALFNMQTHNATISLMDLLETFSQFVIDGAWKDVHNMRRYYSRQRIEAISGCDCDMEQLSNMEFDVSVKESSASPAYRTMANEFLLEVWRAGQITLPQLLKTGHYPFSDELLNQINKENNQETAK